MSRRRHGARSRHARQLLLARPGVVDGEESLHRVAHVPAEQLHLLDAAKSETDERLAQIEGDLRAIAE